VKPDVGEALAKTRVKSKEDIYIQVNIVLTWNTEKVVVAFYSDNTFSVNSRPHSTLRVAINEIPKKADHERPQIVMQPLSKEVAAKYMGKNTDTSRFIQLDIGIIVPLEEAAAEDIDEEMVKVPKELVPAITLISFIELVKDNRVDVKESLEPLAGRTIAEISALAEEDILAESIFENKKSVSSELRKDTRARPARFLPASG